VFENPAAAGWPPQWNCDAAGKPVPGRAWPGGKIIVGKNDASVETIKLMSQTGASVGPRLLGSGFDMFTMASPNQPQQILNIVMAGTNSYTDPNALPGGMPQAPGGLPQAPGGLPQAPGGLPQLPGGAPAAPGGGLPALPGAPQQ
jgi:hypothetical protein